MQYFCSKTTGFLLILEQHSDQPRITHLCESEEYLGAAARNIVALVDDWQPVASTDEATLKRLGGEFYRSRTRLSVCDILQGLSDDLTFDLINDLETSLFPRVNQDRVLDSVLVAPLARIDRCVDVAKKALGRNYAVTAHFFHVLADFQPLLRRVTYNWLRIDNSWFAELPYTRQFLWNAACDAGIVRRCLSSYGRTEFEQEWNKLWFIPELPLQPVDRIAVTRIIKELANAQYPSGLSVADNLNQMSPDVEPWDDSNAPKAKANKAPFEDFNRTLHQIDVIVDLVRAGEDQKARRYIEQLVSEQTGYDGGKERAVKSLCNIAQRCSDMGRLDIELHCLNTAVELQPNDGWTLCQLGDYLKRTRDFDAAEKVYAKAAIHGEAVIAESSLADILKERGYNQLSIEAYKRITGWEDIEVVRIAIADNLRALRRFDEASLEYRVLKERFPFSHRPLVGLAELAVVEGELDSALQYLDTALGMIDLPERSRRIVQLRKCVVLKLQNRIEDAYAIVDDVVRQVPFLMPARLMRGTLLGLMDRANEGLLDMAANSASFHHHDWLRNYFRGLLLFKLKKYSEARDTLISTFEEAGETKDELTVLRLGAAFAYLLDGKSIAVEPLLADAMGSNDPYTNYLVQVLRLHLAMLNEDSSNAAKLASSLVEASKFSVLFKDVVTSLESRDFSQAIQLELRLLLGVSPDVQSLAI